jgi:oligopeptide transport system permease protein
VRSAAALIAVIAVLSCAAPLFAPDPAAQDLARSLEPPSRAHLFGTDLKGRDLLARVLAGTRVSLAVGLAATAVAVVIGVAVGALAGYAGGRTDAALMGAVDVLNGLPFVVFVVVLTVVFGRGLANIFLAIGAVSWLGTARVVRQEVRGLVRREFVDAARALGAGHARILGRHLVPNVLGTVAVYAALTVPQAVRQEALLSFIGLGVEPPAASLGSLLRDGLGALSPLRVEWWLLAFPAAVLALAVFAMNELADAARDRLDPRRRRA